MPTEYLLACTHALAAAAPATDTSQANSAALPSLITSLRSCSKELQDHPELLKQILTDAALLPHLIQSLAWVWSSAAATSQEEGAQSIPIPTLQSQSAIAGPPAESLPLEAAAVFWAAEFLSLGASLSTELAQAALSHGVLGAAARALSGAAGTTSMENPSAASPVSSPVTLLQTQRMLVCQLLTMLTAVLAGSSSMEEAHTAQLADVLASLTPAALTAQLAKSEEAGFVTALQTAAQVLVEQLSAFMGKAPALKEHLDACYQQGCKDTLAAASFVMSIMDCGLRSEEQSVVKIWGKALDMKYLERPLGHLQKFLLLQAGTFAPEPAHEVSAAAKQLAAVSTSARQPPPALKYNQMLEAVQSIVLAMCGTSKDVLQHLSKVVLEVIEQRLDPETEANAREAKLVHLRCSWHVANLCLGAMSYSMLTLNRSSAYRAMYTSCSLLGEAQVSLEGYAGSTCAGGNASLAPAWLDLSNELDQCCDHMVKQLALRYNEVSTQDHIISKIVDRLFQHGLLLNVLQRAQALWETNEWPWGTLSLVLLSTPASRERMRDLGVVPAALAYISKKPGEEMCLRLLRNLAFNSNLHTTLKDCGTVDVVEKVLKGGNVCFEAVILLAFLCSGTDEGSDLKAAELFEAFDVSEKLAAYLNWACSDGVAKWSGDGGSSNVNALLWNIAQSAAAYVRIPKGAVNLVQRGAHLSIITALKNKHGRENAEALSGLVKALMHMSEVPALVKQLKEAGAVAALKSLLPPAKDVVPLSMHTMDMLNSCLLHLGELQDAKAQEALSVSRQDVASASTVAPGQFIWDVFLSHKRSDAKDFARALHTLFNVRGLSAFLDFEWREELTELETAVGSSRNLVFILTDNILSSHWCIKELQAAIKHKTNIILVTREGARWKDSTGAPTCLFPPDELVQSLPEDVRPLFTRKSIMHSDEYYAAFVDQLLIKVKRASTEPIGSLTASTQLVAAPLAQGSPVGLPEACSLVGT
eukprot:gene8087-1330_t